MRLTLRVVSHERLVFVRRKSTAVDLDRTPPVEAQRASAFVRIALALCILFGRFARIVAGHVAEPDLGIVLVVKIDALTDRDGADRLGKLFDLSVAKGLGRSVCRRPSKRQREADKEISRSHLGGLPGNSERPFYSKLLIKYLQP